MRFIPSVFGLMLCACASAAIYSRAIDQSALEQAGTFALGPVEGAPDGYRRTPLTADVVSIVGNITKELLNVHGYREATPGSANLVVRLGAGARTIGNQPASRLDTLGNQADGPFHYTEATLVIDVFDAESSRRVWHGSVFRLIHAGRVDATALRRAVESMLAKFPRCSPPSSSSNQRH